MTQIRSNGVEVPVPSDPYNPPADMAKMADTTDVVWRIPNQTAQNAMTGKRRGTAMVRTDLPGQPMFTWTGTDDSSGGWAAAAPSVEVGQGTNRSVIKGGEALAPTTGFSTGRVVFATPFPNACTGCTLTNSTAAVPFVNFRIIDRQPSYVEFVAQDAAGVGIPNSGLYVNYVAVGH